MKLSQFVKALLPTFGRDRVIEDIRITRGELLELKEVYAEASALLKNTNFKQKDVVKLMSTFKTVLGSGNDNAVVYISKNIDKILKNLDLLETMAAGILTNTLASKGLNYKQATIIRIASNINYVSRFSRKFLKYVYTMESSQYLEDPTDVNYSIPKPEREWIETNFLDFCNAFKSAIFDPEKVQSKIEEIPEAEVNENSEKLMTSTIGSSKLDPLMLGFAGHWLNPIYTIRMAIAEWQVRRYNEAKDEIVLLKLRKKNLENQRSNKTDAKLEKQIQYYESRIEKLAKEISDVEKNYG